MDDMWIVVANQTEARILTHRCGHGVVERETFFCPDSRRSAREIVADSPGHSHDPQGAARHTMETPTAIGEQSAAGFAHRLAERVESGRRQNAFRDLVLVAAPEFLGLLREALGSLSLQRVRAECHKNVADRRLEEILAALPEPVRRSIGNRSSA